MTEGGIDADELRRELSRYKNLYLPIASDEPLSKWNTFAPAFRYEHVAKEFRAMQAYSTDTNKELTAAKAQIAKLNARKESLKSDVKELNTRLLVHGKMSRGAKRVVTEQPESGTPKELLANEKHILPTAPKSQERIFYHVQSKFLVEAMQYFKRAELCVLADVCRLFYRCTDSFQTRPVKLLSCFALHTCDGVAIVGGGERQLECRIGQLLHYELPPSWIRFRSVYIEALSSLNARGATPIHSSTRIGIPWDAVTPSSAFRTTTADGNAKHDSVEFFSRLLTLHGARCFDDCALELVYGESMLSTVDAILNAFANCRAIALAGSGGGQARIDGEGESEPCMHPALKSCANLHIVTPNLLQVSYQRHLHFLRRNLQQGPVAGLRPPNRRAAGALAQQRLRQREVAKEHVGELERLLEAEFELKPESTVELRRAMGSMRDYYRDQLTSTLSLPAAFDAVDEWLVALEVTSGDAIARQELLIAHTVGLPALLALLHGHDKACSTPRHLTVGIPGGETPALHLLLLHILQESFGNAATPSPFVLRFPLIRYEPTKHRMGPTRNATTGEVFECVGSRQPNVQDDETFRLSSMHEYLVVSRLPGLCEQSGGQVWPSSE